jgi:hypothetical protein
MIMPLGRTTRCRSDIGTNSMAVRRRMRLPPGMWFGQRDAELRVSKEQGRY